LTPVLLDTSVIVALIDRTERLHSRCTEIAQAQTAPLITCEAVIAESCHLLRRYRGGAGAVLDNVAAGLFQIPLQLKMAADSVQKVIRKYQDRQVDLADACLVHLATVLDTGDILTLDRDFEVYRWGANKEFRFLVDLS
jgi:predicted nucleic acid-binding protein